MSRRPIVRAVGAEVPAKSRRASSKSISLVIFVGSFPVRAFKAAFTRRRTHAKSREYKALAKACFATSASAGVRGARTPATWRDTRASASSPASTPKLEAAASIAGLVSCCEDDDFNDDEEASRGETTQPSAPSAVSLTSKPTSPRWQTAPRARKAEASSTSSFLMAVRVASKASASSTNLGGTDLPSASRRTAWSVAEKPRSGTDVPRSGSVVVKPRTTW
mmetsp:Transcript_9913/g.32339  ORF Transcript_9913/g.32339 Transcript_9913/m.32339 type:complete len:221 (+) Transcript_9913:1933-2595(+)